MTKAELIAILTEKTSLTHLQIENVYQILFETITAALAKQDKIVIPGFGTFQTKIRAERKGRNPASGKEMIIPKATVVHFKPATQLKESVNQ